MKDKRQPLKKHPLAILLENHQHTITITKDMVGETVYFLPASGAIIACDHYMNDYKERLILTMQKELKPDYVNSLTNVIELIRKS